MSAELAGYGRELLGDSVQAAHRAASRSENELRDHRGHRVWKWAVA
jgi:hypothetical protein